MRSNKFTCIFLAVVFGTSSVIGQTQKPAIEHESLMTMRFYEANGGFLVEGLEVVFPPSNGRAPVAPKITITHGSAVFCVSLILY